jgi:Group 7 allergen
MGLGPTGWVDGSTDQFTMACDFIIDFNDFMIYMQDFRVVSLGNVNINLRGNPLIDWLSNLIISTVSVRGICFSLLINGASFDVAGHRAFPRAHYRAHLAPLQGIPTGND